MAYSIKSVFKGASIYTIGQVGTKAFGFFLIPVYTHFLTPADYGIVGYLQVILQLIATVLMLGFYGAQTRFYYEFKGQAQKFGEFLFSINVFLFFILIILCCTLTQFGEHLYSFFKVKSISFYPYLPIIVWTAFFQIMSQMIISYYLAARQYKVCALLQFVQFFLIVGLVLFFVVFLKQGALGKVKGHLAGQAIFFTLFYISYAKKFIFRFDIAYVKYALAFGLPIAFHLMAGAMHDSIDRVFLEKYVSMDQLGIYSLGYQIAMVMSVIVASVNKAWQPNYFDLMSSDAHDKAYENRRMFALWMIGIGTTCLVGMLWANEFLILLTPKYYHAAAGVVPIIIMGYFFQGMYFFAVSPLFHYKKTKKLPFLTLSSVLVNIFLNLFFVPVFGIYGAAYATLFSFAFQVILVYMISRKMFDPAFEKVKIVVSVSALLLPLLSGLSQSFGFGVQFIKFAYLLGFVVLTSVLFRSYTRPIFMKFYAWLCKAK